MGELNYLPPKPGAKVQVIGAGLPRTATNSFCIAVGILLDGPPYHAGVQYAFTNDEKYMRTMIEAAECVKKLPKEKQKTLNKLESLLDGYVVTCDPPLTLLVPELMEMYPDAKVICTVRERDSWVKSMLHVVKTAQPTLAGFLFFWIPSARWLPNLAQALTELFKDRLGTTIDSHETAMATWDRHHAWLEEIVPKEKLFYFDVKDGWEPLCKALDKPIPDVPFPRLNDGKAFDEHFKKLAIKGISRWLVLLPLMIGLAVGYMWYHGHTPWLGL